MNELLTKTIEQTQFEIIKIEARENLLQQEQEASSKKLSELREQIQKLT